MHINSNISTPCWQSNSNCYPDRPSPRNNAGLNNQYHHLPQVSFPSQQKSYYPPSRHISYIKHQQNPSLSDYSSQHNFSNLTINQSTLVHPPTPGYHPLNNLHPSWSPSSSPSPTPSNYLSQHFHSPHSYQFSPTPYNPAWPYTSYFNEQGVLQASSSENTRYPHTPSFIPQTHSQTHSRSNENNSNNNHHSYYPQDNKKLNPFPFQQFRQSIKLVGLPDEDYEVHRRKQSPNGIINQHSRHSQSKDILLLVQAEQLDQQNKMSSSINESKSSRLNVNLNKSRTRKVSHSPNTHLHIRSQQHQPQNDSKISKSKNRQQGLPSKTFMTKVKGLRNTALYPAPSLQVLPKKHQLEGLPFLKQLFLTHSQQSTAWSTPLSWQSQSSASSSSCKKQNNSHATSNQSSSRKLKQPV